MGVSKRGKRWGCLEIIISRGTISRLANSKKLLNNNALNVLKDQEVIIMSNLKLTEVQRYFDDKLSDAKDITHAINKKVFGIEKDIKVININIQDLKDEIPNSIERSLTETKNKDRKKFWDKYSAPIITGVILIAVQVILHLLKII